MALIRPGPIQGGSVHPYIRRRNGQEPVTYRTRCWRTRWSKTLGVPLFQEQLMQMAIDVAGFTAGRGRRAAPGDGLEAVARADGAAARPALRRAWPANGITGELADEIYEKLLAFANFGFPESHSISFAYLVYASAWFKRYYPAAFCAALLNAQPMGFYSPQSLVADARRHGVVVRRPGRQRSARPRPMLEPRPGGSAGGLAVRLGLAEVRTIGADLAEAIDAERERGGPFRDLADLAGRVRLTAAQAEALATAGAFGCFGQSTGRRRRCGRPGRWRRCAPEQLPGTAVGLDAPRAAGA